MFAEPYSTDSRIGRVDYRDVAEVAAIALTEDRLLYGTFELCADGNFDRHEVASMMGKVLGREIKADTVPFEDWADKAGIPQEGPVRPGLRQMYEWYDAHGFAGNSLALRAILGREPKTLKAYFEELASDGQE